MPLMYVRNTKVAREMTGHTKSIWALTALGPAKVDIPLSYELAPFTDPVIIDFSNRKITTPSLCAYHLGRNI